MRRWIEGRAQAILEGITGSKTETTLLLLLLLLLPEYLSKSNLDLNKLSFDTTTLKALGACGNMRGVKVTGIDLKILGSKYWPYHESIVRIVPTRPRLLYRHLASIKLQLFSLSNLVAHRCPNRFAQEDHISR